MVISEEILFDLIETPAFSETVSLQEWSTAPCLKIT